jgi:RND family efflux transporter MFP subunit
MALRDWKFSLFGVLALLGGQFIVPAAHAELATAPVAQAELPREYRLDGTVEAVHQSTLTAQTTGQVQQVLVDVDDFVQQGTLIIQLKDTEQRAGYAQAEANLQAANAALQEAQKEFERIQGIYARKLVSKADMDRATAALKKAKAQQAAASAALKQASEQLEYTRIRAPYTGIVTKRHIEAGETAHPGQPLITGISLDALRVTVDVPQSLINAVREHGQARVQLPDGDWLTATKLTVFPYADASSNTFKVRAALPPGALGVFPGMSLKVAFIVGSETVTTVPVQAVVHRAEVTGVYVMDEKGRLSLRHVRTGRVLDGKVVVLAGLHVGEQVALDPVAAGVALKRQRGE